jgi:hypothetical protein
VPLRISGILFIEIFMKFNFLIAILFTIFLSACGKQNTEQYMKDGVSLPKGMEIPFQTVEEQRNQGRANASASAADYQRQNPRILGWESIVKADTSHNSKCPQGDGWAEVVFMRSERTEGSTKNLQIEKAAVMCSTVSTAKGCVMVAPTDNWSKHPEKSIDGQCASTNEVPFPLPKVVGVK